MTLINRKNDNVAVFGLGFVGLPLALSFSMRGAQVTGVDVDQELIQELTHGVTHHLEEYQGKKIQDILKEENQSGRFVVTADPAQALEGCTNFIVTVGIPVAQGAHSMEHIRAVCQTIAQGLKQGDLVLIRSTLIPGTMQGYIKPLLEESGLVAGQDFYLAYASERIAEGKAFDEFENMPTLVSGINQDSAQAAKELLQVVTKAEIHIASSMEVVETAKVLENLSRDINIAMVNEFARFTKELGIDIFEVIQMANTHKRVKLLLPGPGVGGYCIPNAFYYLLPKAQEMGVELALSATGRQVNKNRPREVASWVIRHLPVAPAQAKVCVLGVAMKDYSSDDRLSPAWDVVEELVASGLQVAVYDPAVPNKQGRLTDSLEQALAGAHGVVVLARQEGIDHHNLEYMKEHMSPLRPFIVDCRNLYSREKAEHSGFVYEGL